MGNDFIREVRKMAAIIISFAFLFSWIHILKNNILQQEEQPENIEIVKVTPKPSVTPSPSPSPTPTPIEKKEYIIELSDETEISKKVTAQGIDLNIFNLYNSSTVAAIAIPGTRIYYPVCFPFDKNNPGEWLEKNFSLKHSYHGVIYLDSTNNPELDDSINTIYGHNMKDGSMFAGVNRYLKDEKYIKDNSSLFLITESEISIYSAIGILQVKQEDETYRKTSLDSTSAYEIFFRNILEKSKYLAENPLNTGNILELITCSSNHNYRTILFLSKTATIPNVLDEKKDMTAEVEILTKENKNYSSLYSNFVKINSEDDILLITDKDDNEYVWTKDTLEEKYREQLGLNSKYISGYGEFNIEGASFSIYSLNGELYLISKIGNIDNAVEFKISYIPKDEIKVKKL